MITLHVVEIALTLFLIGKVHLMSQSLDRLKTAAANVVAKVQALESQPAGTPDSDLDAISAQLEAVLAPPATPPSDTTTTPPTT